jgi:peptide subunit release factor RF-3
VRWLRDGISAADIAAIKMPTGCRFARDTDEAPVVLFPSAWTLDYFKKQNPDLEVFDLSADAKR